MDHKKKLPKFCISDANGMNGNIDDKHEDVPKDNGNKSQLAHLAPNKEMVTSPRARNMSQSRASCSTVTSQKTNSTHNSSHNGTLKSSLRRSSTSSVITTKSNTHKNLDVGELGERLAYDARFESLYRRIGTTADERRHIWMIHADLEREKTRQLRGIQRDIHLNDTKVRRQEAAILIRQNRLKEEQKKLEQDTKKRHALLNTLRDAHNN